MERPIILKAHEVRGILDGRQTQLRRIVKPSNLLEFLNEAAVIDFTEHSISELNYIRRLWRLINNNDNEPAYVFQPYYVVKRGHMYGGASHNTVGKTVRLASKTDVLCPFGQVGDRLWGRESWADTNYEGSPAISYKATQDRLDLMKRCDFLDADGSFNYDDTRVKGMMFCVWCHDLEGGTEKAGWKHPNRMPRWASRILLEIVSVRVERLQDISEADAEASFCGAGPHTSARDEFKDTWDAYCNSPAIACWDANPWVWVVEFKRVTADE